MDGVGAVGAGVAVAAAGAAPAAAGVSGGSSSGSPSKSDVGVSSSYSVNISENARMAAQNAAEASNPELKSMSFSDDPAKSVKLDQGFNPRKDEENKASSLGSAMASYAAISTLMM